MAVLWSWSLFGINIALCWIHSNMILSIVLHSSMLHFTCQFLIIQWGKINLSVDHPYPAFIETPHILDIPTAQTCSWALAGDWDFCFLTINECSNKLTMVQLLNHLSHFRTLQPNIMKVQSVPHTDQGHISQHTSLLAYGNFCRHNSDVVSWFWYILPDTVCHNMRCSFPSDLHLHSLSHHTSCHTLTKENALTLKSNILVCLFHALNK